MTGRLSYPGRAASPGTALGHLYRTDRPLTGSVPRGADPVRQVAAAFDQVAARLHAVAETLRHQGDEDQADILEVGGFIALDPDLRRHAERRAAEGAGPAEAVRRAVDVHADTIASLDDPVLADRAADVRQVGRRVTAALSVTGGPNSHAAIVARSLGIPLLLDVDPGLLDLPDGVEVLVAGAATVVRPGPVERISALAVMAAVRTRRAELAAERHLPARTRDGHPLTLRANVATPGDVRAALLAGADGVGLLRTELPFLGARHWPTRARHTAALAPVLGLLGGRPVTVRTLDFADDKLPPFLAGDRAGDRVDGGAGGGVGGGTNGRAGGRLGRGLPLMLAQPDAFAEQFRALLETGAGTALRIMIPMVAEVGELRACQALLDRAAGELGVAAPPLGIMVELPEAVARIDELAHEAAFLSLGTNDLTSQILGLDRRDPAAGPAQSAHPAVLRAVAAVVAAARRHRRPVSVCGDAAAHPLVLPLFVGLGCDTLSVAPAVLDEVRAAVRRLDRADCAALATDALSLDSAEEVHRLVRARLAVPRG